MYVLLVDYHNCYCIHCLYVQCVQLTDSNCIPEENVTPVKDIVTDKMSPLVETIQPSTPSDVIDNDHSIVVEVSYFYTPPFFMQP